MGSKVGNNEDLPEFDVVIVDECHHLKSKTYDRVLEELRVGKPHGPFLLGLTATPWRPDGSDFSDLFGEPVISKDFIEGIKDGYLSELDYRVYTNNIDWEALANREDGAVTPKDLNRKIFIPEWDEAVLQKTQEVWEEIDSIDQLNPRGIVFCQTIEHCKRMTAKLNAMEFTLVKSIYSGGDIDPLEKKKILWDFADGKIGIICAVDVLNEGVDVPDVNFIVFQRVTHSKRIFVQQLGRGLRLAKGKSKLIAVDFVADIRRVAETLILQNEVSKITTDEIQKIGLGSSVKFLLDNTEDIKGHKVLSEWLSNLDAISEADEDTSIQKFLN